HARHDERRAGGRAGGGFADFDVGVHHAAAGAQIEVVALGAVGGERVELRASPGEIVVAADDTDLHVGGAHCVKERCVVRLGGGAFELEAEATESLGEYSAGEGVADVFL